MPAAARPGALSGHYPAFRYYAVLGLLLEFVMQLQREYPKVPVYMYTSLDTATLRGPELEAAGARIVTSSFTELSTAIARDARMSFDAEVERILVEVASGVQAQMAGVDFVATVGPNGLRVGIEAKDFRRTPKAHAVDAAAQLLGQGIEKGAISRGLVVAPRDVFIQAQRDRAPAGVELIAIAQLAEALGQLAAV